ncbi:MAG TPA: methylmalonyl-CoA mutase family protein [Candidatus Polarisedimenticolia bacterium]|nr:methylmalonyl-CoA mutase family protein [Candidatus Polarisedimenticolia bacterium]
MSDKPDAARHAAGAAAAGRQGPFSTDPGLEPDVVHTPRHTESLDPVRDIGFPGEPPFTRGIQPTMHRGRFWTMRQYAGFGTAAETNRRFRYLLQQGQTGLSVAFDLPTQMGYDSDHAMAAGEVGRSGVAIDSIDDMETLLAEIPLDRVSTSMTINATASTLLCLYVAAARRRGIPAEALSGTIQNDILKEYAARGTYIYPPGPSMRLVTDTLAWCAANLPRWNPISVSGYHMREAGCTAVQEVGFTLANGLAYLLAARERGQEVAALAPRISFFFAAHTNLLEEVAKFRAARRLWGRLLSERFGLTDPRALMMRFHTQTGGSTLTAQQPENNIVRVAVQALAGVLGGTQSLHTNAMDEALALPTERSATIALRTQQILAEESGVANTVDPVAGSYFVESLTARIETNARALIEDLDARGGAVASIQTGYVQKQIQEAAYRYHTEVESGRRGVVGINRHADGPAARVPLHRLDSALERRQADRVAALRAGRDDAPAGRALGALREAAQGADNLLPFILAAVEAKATLGEIADTMRGVFSTHGEGEA